MSGGAFLQLVAMLVALAVTVPLLGRYMAAVYGARDDGSAPGDRVFLPVERSLYRLFGVDPEREQRWNVYALSLLAFSVASVALLYALLRLQPVLPFNPTDMPAVEPGVAFNTAVSFMTNTNWQAYGGEATLSHLSQMVGLTVQNFVSAAAGMAVLVAIVRGITRQGQDTLGNFWVDLTRTVLRILLPLSFVVALALVSQGVIQDLSGFEEYTAVDGTEQVVPGGPVASQVAIKQLGTNGGGFFSSNSAVPFENPNPISGFVENWAILAIPLAFPITYGLLVRDRRQGQVLLGVMLALWLAAVLATTFAQTGGNAALPAGVDQSISAELAGGGSLEGAETRFGSAGCGLWAASTTGTSNGSVNCLVDSSTPVGGMVPMVNMMLGEVSPGGVGVGLMGLLVFALLAVFIAGLMVGRTPELLGKKIQAQEVKLAMLFLLAAPLMILGFSAASVVTDAGLDGIQDPGAHGLSEVLYGFSSGAGNNGSAFAGLAAADTWYATTIGISMLVGRFFLIIPALAIAGSLGRKRRVPVTDGTFPTHTPLFGGLVTGVVLIVGGLTFFPALALGPIAEALAL
ncbi:potassium-transporting ATPase subunit KdpA [Iamia majanohamensis]|uniref:Potassium-transporting ATPase potassium-binding subunit n=1 Tax=Iamia majanohamensis TaxID=467976 RepID=A0AAE9Y9R1_9ACTN|nr:potassium-transporting ATPase subunit KdpA [Iamia majanohamensis]WCO67158.1 potassium-transporting ATPase subunit KdpA [Iamia majanohamensis]